MPQPRSSALWARHGGHVRCRRHLGFSLPEVMIGVAVGLLLVAGVMTAYLQASSSTTEMARLNRQIEGGRFALQMLREDLWHAGFWGEYSPPQTTPTANPDPCSAFGTWTAADQANFLALPVVGYDDGAGLPASCTDADGPVTHRKAGTDVLVVRRASTCVADSGEDNNCEDVAAGKPYLQVSLCSIDAAPFVLATDEDISDPAPFTLRKRDSAGKGCTAIGYATTYAGRRKLISHIYYVRDRSDPNVADGIPTLMRSDLDLAGGVVRHQPAQSLVEGIEHMEIEYGVDTDGDGGPDGFTSAPADAIAWGNVVAIKIHLLARTIEATRGHMDSKTYDLGLNPPEVFEAPLNDGFRRHVFSTYVRLHNPAGRRDKP